MQTKDEWILEDHLGLQIIRCPKCNQAINCNQYGLYYKEHYKFCPFCGKPMKVPESPITHMPLIPPTEEILTDDERWNRKIEKMKRVVQIWKRRKEHKQNTKNESDYDNSKENDEAIPEWASGLYDKFMESN